MLSKQMIDKITEEQFHRKSGATKTIIDQMNFLQNTLGNQKVQELIHTGVLSVNSETPGRMEIQNDNQKEQETELMLADREALNPEIDKLIDKNEPLLEELKINSPGKNIYVNVKTTMHFVKTPGNPPHEFYHYTDLADVSFSLQNINKTGKAEEITRGYTIEVIDSYMYKVETEIINNQEEIPEEEVLKAEEITEAEKETNNTLA